MAITFNGFNIDDNTNYIVTSIKGDRGMPSRNVITKEISRREGVRILGDNFRAKKISIQGAVYDDTVSGFESKLDDLKKRLANFQGELQIDDDRTYTATVQSLDIAETSEALTWGSFNIDFVVNEGFATGSLQTVSLTATSGITTVSGLVTISGTAFMRPTLGITIDDGSGLTAISNIDVTHLNTGEIVSWSGTVVGGNLNRGDVLLFNYDNYTILRNGTSQDYTGIFSKWEPGDNTFVVTFTAAPPGGTIDLSYTPNYY
jgi:predicted phage tail component-like protein